MTISPITSSATLRVLLNGALNTGTPRAPRCPQVDLVGADAEAADCQQFVRALQGFLGQARAAAQAQQVHAGERAGQRRAVQRSGQAGDVDVTGAREQVDGAVRHPFQQQDSHLVKRRRQPVGERRGVIHGAWFVRINDGVSGNAGDRAGSSRQRVASPARHHGALRDPASGCPWDVAQDFATIAPYTIEEAYEVADAIPRRDFAALPDELGDLLFQVVYHARMAEEAGHFGFAEVARQIADKMVRRHPHVFGDAAARDRGGCRWRRGRSRNAPSGRRARRPAPWPAFRSACPP